MTNILEMQVEQKRQWLGSYGIYNSAKLVD